MKVILYTDFDDFRDNGQAGSICFIENVEHDVRGFGIKCVGCGHESYLPIVHPEESVIGPHWYWDQNVESPTLSPSIYHKVGCGWHGYLRNGIWEVC